MTHVKVCCIQNEEEIALAARRGAAAVGFVSEMPSGPGVLSEEKIAALVPEVPEGVLSFLLTSATDAATVVDQVRGAGVDAVQAVDRVSAETHGSLRSELSGVTIVQVVHVSGQESVREAARVAPRVDALLLDSGRPDTAHRELGGTGRTHDWEASRRIRERVDVPVWLAGGLRPGNVAEAVRTVRPHGVDVCSGLRPDGFLDEDLLSSFAEAVRGATA